MDWLTWVTAAEKSSEMKANKEGTNDLLMIPSPPHWQMLE